MPSLFGSRRRGSSAQPPVDRSTSSSAALAASQAMFQQRTASMTLSSAAAAAALRSQTTTPEPVGSIQTKRMVRRGSVSSVGSGVGSVIGGGRGGYTTARPGLSRQNSSGSMTERTFRVQSPAGRNGSLSPVNTAVPPVPAIPSKLSPSGSQRRSTSLEPAPMRMTSPGPAPNGRAMSVDRRNNNAAPAAMPNKPPGSHRGSKRLSNVAEMNEPVDHGARKTNFSRPISPSSSPPASPINASRSANYYGNGTTPSPRAMRPSPIATNIPEAAAPPPREQEVVMVFDPASRKFVPRTKDKPKPVEPASPLLPPPKPLQPGEYDPSTRSIVPGAAAAPATMAALVASDALASATPAAAVASTPPPPSQQSAGTAQDTATIQPPPRHPGRALSPTPSTLGDAARAQREAPASSTAGKEQQQQRLAPLQTSAAAPSAKVAASSSLSPAVTPQKKAGGLRNGSSSPSPASRSAHFSVSPVIEAIRHNPPPRDLSPVKSALKHHAGSPASSLRAASPLAHLGRPASVYSETGSVASQDAGAPSSASKKKKSVRVSFDEQALEIAPETTTAPVAAALARRNLDDDSDDDAETMKPRPALPSFGSVRRTSREYPVSTTTEGAVADAGAANASASSDLAIGGVLATDALTRKIAGEAEVPLKHESGGGGGDAVGKSSEDFPAIQLQPPTPGEEGQPLGEAVEAEEQSAPSIAAEDTAGEDNSAATAADLLTPIGEDSDDSDKDFSDAPEELAPAPDNDDEEHSELENGGFISLDAVAVSPVHAAVSSAVRPLSYAAAESSSSPTGTPSKHQRASVAASEGAIDGKGSGDWTEATAYWKQLSRQQREKIEREHAAVEDDDDDEEEDVNKSAPPVVVGATSSAAASAPSALEDSPDVAATAPKPKVTAASPAVRTPAKQNPVIPAPSPQPAMKKTLRAQPAPTPAPPVEGEVRMRRSMRDGGGGGMMAGGASLRNRSASAASRQEQPIYSRNSVAAAPTRPSPVTRLSSTASITSTASRTPAPPATARPAALNRLSSTGSTASRTPAPPVVSARLQKELANDSDSESSFRKKRRSAANGSAAASSGRYSMKRSMRAAPAHTAVEEQRRPFASQQRAQSPPGRGKGRDSFSVRSLSPAGSFFGRRRKRSVSVEPTADNNRMSLRNGNTGFSSTKSNGRPMSAQQPAPVPVPAPSSRFRSKFSRDSDDDDDDNAGARPARTTGGFFRSRFADSDDEDDAGSILTPVRGIPRTFGRDDGDSTDLDGEEEDPRKASRKRERFATPGVPNSADIDAAMDAARRKLGIVAPAAPPETNHVLTPVTSTAQEPKSRPEDLRNDDAGNVPPASPTTEKKKGRGLMSSLLRRNRGSTASVPTVDLTQRTSTSSPIPPASPIVTSTPTKKEQRLMALAAESPSTPNNKNTNRASIVSVSPPILPPIRRGNSNYSTMTAPEAWPISNGDDLPPVPKIPDGHLRPSTSDGGFADPRRNSVRFSDAGDETFGPGTPQSARTPAAEVFSTRTGKKKRFPALRRAFGLND